MVEIEARESRNDLNGGPKSINTHLEFICSSHLDLILCSKMKLYASYLSI
ncbi:hypothetical protein Hanom_Chr02g00148611 [Helianthus anomalus]